MSDKPQTLQQAIVYFADESVAREYLANARWPEGVECPHCKGKEHSYITTESDMVGVAVPGSERGESVTRMARFTQSGWRVKGGESVELQEWHGRPVHVTSYH